MKIEFRTYKNYTSGIMTNKTIEKLNKCSLPRLQRMYLKHHYRLLKYLDAVELVGHIDKSSEIYQKLLKRKSHHFWCREGILRIIKNKE